MLKSCQQSLKDFTILQISWAQTARKHAKDAIQHRESKAAL